MIKLEEERSPAQLPPLRLVREQLRSAVARRWRDGGGAVVVFSS